MPRRAPDLLRDLARPDAYPPPRPSAVERVTTHISWVFLTDREAWKVKRPVDYGFLDFTDAGTRERLCRAEVRLNRRLAPDVYRGVVPLLLGPGGYAFLGRGRVVDHAVRMRRLPDDRSAGALMDAGRLDARRLEHLAAFLARFYAGAREVPAFGEPDVVEGNVRENFEQVAPFVGRLVDSRTFRRVREWQERFLAGARDVLRERVVAGRIREGHGDLRLEHVYFEEGRRRPTVIDAIEFNERFRCGDVASDVAFLAMEMEARGRHDLSGRFLGAFAERSGDFDLYRVVDLYLSYRAWVRGKVAAFVAADRATPRAKARRKAGEARRLFALAARYAEPAAGPAPVIAVGGLIGSGKSTVAAEVARRLGLPVVSSDETRKRLAGLEPTDRAGAAAYAPEFSRRTFDEVFRRAGVVVGSGRGVVLDATFRTRDLRARARRLATGNGRPFLFLETRCGDAALRRRLRTRSAGRSVSDATAALLPRMRREFEPVDDLPGAEHLVFDTERPGSDPSAIVLERLGLEGP